MSQSELNAACEEVFKGNILEFDYFGVYMDLVTVPIVVRTKCWADNCFKLFSSCTCFS